MFEYCEISLSPYSKVFFNEWKLNPERSDYNIVFDQNLQGKLDISKLTGALVRFVLEHLLCNSHIKEGKDEIAFWVKNSEVYGLQYFQSNKLTNQEILKYIQEPFNLELGLLYRFVLIKNNDIEHRLIIVLHHIIIDGLSFDYLIEELSNYYNDELYKNNISIKKQLLQISELSQVLSSS